MLLNRKAKPPRKRPDWFPGKTYLHFDGPAKRRVAERIVCDPDAVSTHSFLPLIAFDKRERRYRRKKGKAAEIKTKIRRIAYAGNMDACIFAYYAHLLDGPYERLIEELQIDKCVIGYRKIGTNLDLALDAFSEIRYRGSCIAFAFDISGFFDNIEHAVLERNWCRVLKKSALPKGHDKVFQNLTRFSTVNRQACLVRLGYKRTSKDREIANRPICSIKEFRQMIRGKGSSLTNLVVPWERNYRIPQGTPISAVAANIAMIDFDVQMNSAIKALGGSYRRYSDDILIIVPTPARSLVSNILDTNLKYCTRRLKINNNKTDVIEFIPGALANGQGSKALQYLGFLFDGNRHLLRGGTISKFYRRMHQEVYQAKKQAEKVTAGHIHGRSTLHKRSVLASVTHLGVKNFVSSYAASAKAKSGGKDIAGQLARHMRKANDLMSR